MFYFERKFKMGFHHQLGFIKNKQTQINRTQFSPMNNTIQKCINSNERQQFTFVVVWFIRSSLTLMQKE